eukprot:TRINITY_DN2113_c0_g1::TRINITY_DN2113_c0_g1_i1::g.12814::m.12814 TRINITY_DN2113_c0_g1::TRINITY_DN2113_c0_g1_i1::g.12814  ORF type:complete len:711 (+),score=255.51,sp/A0A0H2VDN9/ESIB_ECOL6/35.90/4e-29,sp/A0A0H2VDN9/ESIB_ECOL6/29.93/1e-24,sp/A0A0H2VDN9/ESIB_ECOL6/33.95/1e-23,sp/A0A0H2VDN9/ESIB_ECOL6/40.16/3e-12,sp/A0A0H2VDN9/ESIB_ECOL6/35.96/8e-06,Sel1/PF08238.7/0.031,Sel1/PF08238.7/4.9e-09,Sel1/PF08238.7/2.6e-08,Sel1/PF08238.7/2.2e-09,Sel1/PF08238.7/3.6e-07,Sel1/PF08238.7/1.8e-06,Arm/PF00514.18/6
MGWNKKEDDPADQLVRGLQGDVQSQEIACRHLGVLTTSNKVKQIESFLKAGGLPSLMPLISSFDAEVAFRATVALANFTCYESAIQPLIDIGALRTLLLAAQRSYDLSAREHAMRGLSNLAALPDARRAMDIPPVVLIATECLNARPEKLRAQAANVLVNLSSDPQNHGIISSASLTTALKCMWLESDARCKLLFTMLLTNLVHNEPARVMVVQQGGITLLQRLSRDSDPKVKAQAEKALSLYPHSLEEASFYTSPKNKKKLKKKHSDNSTDNDSDDEKKDKKDGEHKDHSDHEKDHKDKEAPSTPKKALAGAGVGAGVGMSHSPRLASTPMSPSNSLFASPARLAEKPGQYYPPDSALLSVDEGFAEAMQSWQEEHTHAANRKLTQVVKLDQHCVHALLALYLILRRQPDLRRSDEMTYQQLLEQAKAAPQAAKDHSRQLLQDMTHAGAAQHLAQLVLGVFYDMVEDDAEAAVIWYTKAAESGCNIAQNALGYCFESGRGVNKDPVQALAWYLKSAEDGDMTGQFNVAVCYQKGEVVEKNLITAVKWYKLAADQGHPAAQNNLGFCYREGLGMPQPEPELAVEYYRKAAEIGDHTGAMYNLGHCFETGKGAVQSWDQAVTWYKHAAERGHPLAMASLAECYVNGTGVKVNYAEAEKWFEKANQLGLPRSQVVKKVKGKLGGKEEMTKKKSVANAFKDFFSIFTAMADEE